MAELVTGYQEGSLPWHRRWPAWLHLRACAACTAYFDQMRRTVDFLRQAGSGAVPESEVDHVLRQTEPPSRPL
jgi:predicted anti-sigma-YlaC factor YlaD